MKCFNCGDDADMKVLVMINGKLQEVEICSNCYKEQMQEMIEHFKGGNGEFDPEEMQKFMYKILTENKDEFEKIFGSLADGIDFDFSKLNPNNIHVEFNDASSMGFGKDDLDKFIDETMKNRGYKNNSQDLNNKDKYKQINFEEVRNQKEIKMLRNSVDKKKQQLNSYILSEDYMAAATLRDQIKDINKRIMIIMELEKENER